MLRGESKIDSALATKYEDLVDFDHHSQLNLTLYLLDKKHGKTIGDLVNLRIHEIKNRPILIAQYRSRWQRDYWYGYTDLSFDEFLNKTVTEEEDLTTVDSIATFFKKRRAVYGIDIYEDLNELHKHVHGIEVKILEQLNVIEDDYCCEEQPSEWIPTRPPYTDGTTTPPPWSSWPKATTSRPSWTKVPKRTVTTTAPWTTSTAARPPLTTTRQQGDTTNPPPVNGSGDSEGSSGDKEEDDYPFEETDDYFDY